MVLPVPHERQEARTSRAPQVATLPSPLHPTRLRPHISGRLRKCPIDQSPQRPARQNPLPADLRQKGFHKRSYDSERRLPLWAHRPNPPRGRSHAFRPIGERAEAAPTATRFPGGMAWARPRPRLDWAQFACYLVTLHRLSADASIACPCM